jgi:hypothetical protein
MRSYAYRPTLNRKCCEGRSGSVKGVPCSSHVSCHWILFHLMFCNWLGWLERSWTLAPSVITAEGNEVCETTVLWNIMTTFFHPVFHLQQFLCHCRWYIMHMFSRTWFLITWACLTVSLFSNHMQSLKSVSGIWGVTNLKSGADCRHTTIHRMWA